MKILGFVRDPPDLARCVLVDRNWRAFFEEAQRRTELEQWWGQCVVRCKARDVVLKKKRSSEWASSEEIARPTLLFLDRFPFPWNQPRSLDACLRTCSNGKLSVENLSAPFLRLMRLPEELFLLKGLRSLNLSCNRLVHLPENMGNLTSLQHLDLSHNRLATVPRELGKLKYLRRLDLSHNRLSTLPLEFVGLRHDIVTVKPGNPHLYVPDILNPQVKSIDPSKGRNKRGRRSRQV